MMNSRDTVRESHSRCRAIVNTHKKYDHKAQRIILNKYRETGDVAYRHLLVEANYAFTYSVATRYARTSHHDVFDLFTEGNMGVGEAADDFDLSCDYHFITYAVWHIRKRILKYMTVNYGGLVSVGQVSAKKDAKAKRLGEDSNIVLPTYAATVNKNGNLECIFDNMAQTTFDDLDNFEEESTQNKVLANIKSLMPTLTSLERDIINLYYTGDMVMTQLCNKHKMCRKKFPVICRALADKIRENVSNKMVVELGYDLNSRFK